MGTLTAAYEMLGTVVMVCIAVLIVACLIRSVLGPRVADRVVAVNSIGTMTIVVIALLSVMLDEAYLLDVCLIYAMISFLAVVVLTKIYTGVYREEKSEEESEKSEGESEESGKESEKSEGESEESGKESEKSEEESELNSDDEKEAENQKKSNDINKTKKNNKKNNKKNTKKEEV